MLSIVCSARYAEPVEDMGTVLVFAPPSNVRSSPGGSVKCTLSEMSVISVYVEPQDGWYSTDTCGGGWIHESSEINCDARKSGSKELTAIVILTKTYLPILNRNVKPTAKP
jgi:hypothetical protein